MSYGKSALEKELSDHLIFSLNQLSYEWQSFYSSVGGGSPTQAHLISLNEVLIRQE